MGTLARHMPAPQLPAIAQLYQPPNQQWATQTHLRTGVPNPYYKGGQPNTNTGPGQVPTTPYGNPTPPGGGFRPIGDDQIQGVGQINQPQTPTVQQPNPYIPPPSTTPTQNPPTSGGGGGGGVIQQPTQTAPQTQLPSLPSGNINTSINPLIVYPESLTEAARNQIVATQAQASDPRWLTKRFASPGRSLDAGTASAAMPFLAQSQFLGNQGYANLSLGDFLANQESLLAGEIAREKEGLGLGNLLARLQEGNISSVNSLLNPLLSSLLS